MMPVSSKLSDSYDESQPQCGAMTIVVKPKKHVSPLLMNSMLVGITHSNSDFQRISECDAFVDRVPGNDEINAQMSFSPGWAGWVPPARAVRPGPAITALVPRHHSGCARGSLWPLGHITPGPPGNPLNPAPGVKPQLWTFSQPSTCCVLCP